MDKKGLRCIPTRVVLAILCATGVMELYMTRTNLSIAIVAMVQTVGSERLENNVQEPYCVEVKKTANRSTDSASITSFTSDSNETLYVDESVDDFRIKLTSTQRGFILSAFFYVYGITALLGGRLAERYGTKMVFGTAVLVDAVGNLLIPFAMKTHYFLLIAIRIIMGLCQGACYPSLHHVVSEWIPYDESSRFIAFVYPSSCFGTTFALNVCGLIISKFGWEPVFYICGSIGLIWLAFWILLMHDSPNDHPRISCVEKNYILNLRKKTTVKAKKVPWKEMALSLPLWAINIAHSGTMFAIGLLLTQLPIYMNSIIGVNIKTNGFLSSLPFLARFFGSIAFSAISIYLKKKTNWHPKTWQRILTIIGFWGSTVSFLVVGYVGCNGNAAMTLFIIGMALNGANLSGYPCNSLQIAPNFAGTALGISTSIAFFYAMTAPVIVGVLTPEETLREWINVFWVVFASSFTTGTFYLIFLSTESQPWNDINEKKPERKKEGESEIGLKSDFDISNIKNNIEMKEIC